MVDNEKPLYSSLHKVDCSMNYHFVTYEKGVQSLFYSSQRQS